MATNMWSVSLRRPESDSQQYYQAMGFVEITLLLGAVATSHSSYSPNPANGFTLKVYLLVSLAIHGVWQWFQSPIGTTLSHFERSRIFLSGVQQLRVGWDPFRDEGRQLARLFRASHL